MKKLVSAFFIIVFFYTLFGYYPVFLIQQYQIKKEIKLRIKQSVPENELNIITASPEVVSRLVWIDKNEFRLDGNLYDVVVVDRNPKGEVVYKCILDSKEKKLFSHLDKLIQNAFDDKNGNSKKKNSVLKNLVKDYLPVSPAFSSRYRSEIVKYEVVSSILTHISLEKITPPPKSS